MVLEGGWPVEETANCQILLWDFHQNDIGTPCRRYLGPRMNIFTLAFSSTNQYLYSGDTANTIHEYDISRSSPSGNLGGESRNASFSQHTDSIRAISCHPEQDHIFLSASEDGSIIMHDSRADSRLTRAQGVLQHDTEFTGVQYHPTMPHIFATGDYRGQVCLRDTRMAFGPLSQRRQQGIVQTYVTTISRQSASHMSNPESSSITFNGTGTTLAVTMLCYLPTIFTISDPYPIAVCSGENLPGGAIVPAGERTYSNCCTTKNGSFGGTAVDGEEYYCGGSDDFRAYVWKIPATSYLLECREELNPGEWVDGQLPGTVAFASSPASTRYLPLKLSTPLCRLNGHQSIVNTALMHPHYLYIMTSGIERHITLHSATSASPCATNIPPTSPNVRPLYSMYSRYHGSFRDASEREDAAEDTDDERTIALFDEIIRQEGNTDVFSLRHWGPDQESDSEAE